MTDAATEIVLRSLDPAAHPSLCDLGKRLNGLAGDSAYAAGRDYLKKGLIRHATIAETTAHATVTGSTDYRITVNFAANLVETKVTCTCPAHRRSRHCKHVVAVVLALLERPGDFTPVASVELPPESAPPKRRRSSGGGTVKERAAIQRAEQQSVGLDVVDRLIEELAAGGLVALSSDGGALLAEAAETVRALKLRRLGNQLLALQRLVGPAPEHGALTIAQALAMTRTLVPGVQPARGGAAEPLPLDAQAARFADLLADIVLTRQALGARANGHANLDPALAEELLGKTWRDSELERVSGLDLCPLGDERTDDGEFKVETSYLLDLTDGAIYLERQISPRRLRAVAKPVHRYRLLVDEAGRYPGAAPHRLKLINGRRAPLTVEHVGRLLSLAATDASTLRASLVERLRVPFVPLEIAVLFKPAAILRDRGRFGAIDRAGRFLPLRLPGRLDKEILPILPESGRYALFGRLCPSDDPSGMALHGLSVVGELHWGNGPICPDVGG